MFLSTNKLKDINTIDVKIAGLKIIKKIGEGGMSMVYLAEQISLKRKVAVKVMRLEIASNELDVQRFKHEAKTIAHLDHPSIINIYDIGQTAKGEIYFTMPYLNHGDFSNYILEDELEFIKLLQSICQGLSFAHNRGVVHRDIKPENLLFDKFGNAQIADFGIAISKDGSRMTKEHQVVGSAQYMSPEQARSSKVGIHSDIYSLGIVIYERLTGVVPFDADDSITILVNHVSAEPPKLPAKMRHWQNLIDKCLAKLPKDRFQSMPELNCALSKVPTNSLQRTNNSIQSVLQTNNGKHLKWFIPSLIVLLIAVVFGLIKKIPEKTNNDNLPLVYQTTKQDEIVNDVELITETINQGTNKAVSTIDVSARKGQVLNNQTINEQTSEKLIIEDQIIQNYTVVLTEDDKTTIDDQLPNEAIEGLNLDVEIEELLAKALKNIKKYRLTKPKNDNANDQLLGVLAIEPKNLEALAGLESIGGKYYQLVKSALEKFDLNTALKYSKLLKSFNANISFGYKNYSQQQKKIIKLISQIDVSTPSISATKVNTLVRIIKVFDSENQLISSLLNEANKKTGPQIGEKFMDDLGIETILVTNKLAIALTETTVEQYTKFTQDTNRGAGKCKHPSGGIGKFFKKITWDNPRIDQNSEHPVICVSQSDAHQYSQWLSIQTDKQYRLPTQQEWLDIVKLSNNNFKECKSANLTGSEAINIKNKEDKFDCNDSFKNTAPVASFSKNNIGLYDVYGNVSEWIACEQPCKIPTAMGTSWYHGVQSNIADKSTTFKEYNAFTNIGFRVVRDL